MFIQVKLRLIQLSLFYQSLKADGTKLYLQSKNVCQNFKLFLFDIQFCLNNRSLSRLAFSVTLFMASREASIAAINFRSFNTGLLTSIVP